MAVVRDVACGHGCCDGGWGAARASPRARPAGFRRCPRQLSRHSSPIGSTSWAATQGEPQMASGWSQSAGPSLALAGLAAWQLCWRGIRCACVTGPAQSWHAPPSPRRAGPPGLTLACPQALCDTNRLRIKASMATAKSTTTALRSACRNASCFAPRRVALLHAGQPPKNRRVRSRILSGSHRHGTLSASVQPAFTAEWPAR